MAPRIQIEMTSQEAQAWAGIQKLVTQQDALKNKFKQTKEGARGVGTEMQTAGKHGSKAFGPSAAGQLKTFALQFVGISKAISIATQLLNDMSQAGVDAALKSKEALMGMGPLSQLVHSPQEHKALLAEARVAFGTGVGKSRTEAGDLMYQLWAAGFTREDRDLFVEMGATGYLKTADVTEMAGALVGFRESMGVKEVGSVRDLLNKAIGAAAATTTSPAGILMGAVTPSGEAAALGLSDEELLAFHSVVTKMRVDPRKSGTYVNAFLAEIAKSPEFEGKGMSLKEIVQTIEAKGLSRGEVGLLAGGKRGVKAFDDIRKNMDFYEKQLADIHAQQAADPLTKQLKFFETDPTLKHAQHATAAAHRKELAADKLGQARNLYDQLLDQWEVERREKGGPLERWDIATTRASAAIQEKLFGPRFVLEKSREWVEHPQTRADIRDLLGPEYSMLEGFRSTAHAPQTATMSPELADKFLGAVTKLDEVADKMKDGARGPTLVPPNVDR